MKLTRRHSRRVSTCPRGSELRKLDDRVAVITGAASGIGAACARVFAREGARIAGIDLQPAVDGAWEGVLEASSESALDVGIDVRDEIQVRDAVARIVDQFGRIDVLVNAAGVGSATPIHALELEEWDRVIDINLKGSFLVAKHVLAPMLEQHSGNIIHVASVEGLEGMSTAAAYNASKGGVVIMTKNMAIDYGREGIRVNCLCPGLIETPLTAPLRELPDLKPVHDAMESWHALGRIGRPDEVANAALFLASDESSFVHGASLVVDGGWTAGRRL